MYSLYISKKKYIPVLALKKSITNNGCQQSQFYERAALRSAHHTFMTIPNILIARRVSIEGGESSLTKTIIWFNY